MSHSVQVITSGKSLQAVPVYPGSTAPITIQGATGPSGPTGPVGGQGAQGLAGPMGTRGVTGPAGGIGVTGPAGNIGPAGPTGPLDGTITQSLVPDTSGVYSLGSASKTFSELFVDSSSIYIGGVKITADPVAGTIQTQGPSDSEPTPIVTNYTGLNFHAYPTTGDLPSSSDKHGMLAHVHNEGAVYLAHAGSWEKIYPNTSGPTGPVGPAGADGPTGPAGGPVGPTGPTGADSTVQGPTGPIGLIGPTGPSGRFGEPGGNCQTFIYYTGIDTIPHSEVAASGHLSLYTPSIDVPQNSKAVIFDYFDYASHSISGWGDTFSHPGQVKIFQYDNAANYAVYELTRDTSTSLGSPWPQLKDACQNGGTVTIKYSFIAAGNTSSDGHIQGQNATYQLKDYNDSSVTFAAFTGEIGAALEEWKGLFESVYPNLTLNFTNMGEEVTNTVRSDTYGGTYAIPHPDCSNIGDFRFGMHKIDHAGNVLAHGYSPGGILGVSGNHGGDIHFDYAEDWRTDTTNNTFNHNNDPNAFSIKYVTAHEVGHAFGLGHDSDSSSILYPSVTSATNFYQSFPSGLKHSLVERRAVERVYGEADYNRKYITFLDGNLNLNDSDLVSMCYIASGPTGPQGPQGPAGGPTGSTGPQGNQGPMGSTGAQGSQGPAGPTGADSSVVGPTGPAGSAGATGAQGSQGPAGPTGSQGAQGSAGATGADSTVAGPAGATGAQGSQGPAGPTGSQGAQGVAGPTGAQGAQGVAGPTGADSAVAGPTGPAGAQGAAGPTGSDSTVAGPTGAAGAAGSDGATGPAGDTGAQGSAGAAGPTGPGDTYVTTSTTSLTIGTGSKSLTVGTGLSYSSGQTAIIAYDNSNKMEGSVTSYNSGTGALVVNVTSVTGSGTHTSWDVNLSGAPGPAGDAGPTGAQGAAGAAGPTGAQGAAGAAGPTGAQGAAGAAGPTGAQGAAGAAGPTGAQGAAGAAGPTGAQGAAGAAGPTGAQGAQGVAGPTGAQGAAGAAGATGAAGSDGSDGSAGAAGPTGAQGAQGVAGPTGAQGAQGVAGPTGAQGAAGAAGATGAAGSAGAAGATGAQGAQGVAGPTGAQGAAGAAGPTGAQGAAGAAGATGAAGSATINNATENELVTVASTTTELDAEASLTFDDTNGLYIAKSIKTAVKTHSISSGAANITLDFEHEPLQTMTLNGGNLSLNNAVGNKEAGRSMVVRIVCDGSDRTLTFHSSWKFVGEKPASIAANKIALLSMTCFGTGETDIVCSYAVQD